MPPLRPNRDNMIRIFDFCCHKKVSAYYRPGLSAFLKLLSLYESWFFLIRQTPFPIPTHFYCLSPWRVNYKLIEFDIKYPAVVIFFFSDLRPELELDLLHQFQEGFIRLIRLSSFFCRNTDQMQKQRDVCLEKNAQRDLFHFCFQPSWVE